MKGELKLMIPLKTHTIYNRNIKKYSFILGKC